MKFLHPVQQGDIRLWREGFYLPLVAASVSLSLNAFRRHAMPPLAENFATDEAPGTLSRPAYGWPVRIGLLLLAVCRRSQLAAAGLDAPRVGDTGVSFANSCAAHVPRAGRGQSHCRTVRDAAVHR